MTISQMAWAWKEVGLNPEQRIVLMSIADGNRWPSVIAERCEMNISRVQEILDLLVSRYAITFSIGDEETSYRIESCRRRGHA